MLLLVNRSWRMNTAHLSWDSILYQDVDCYLYVIALHYNPTPLSRTILLEGGWCWRLSWGNDFINEWGARGIHCDTSKKQTSEDWKCIEQSSSSMGLHHPYQNRAERKIKTIILVLLRSLSLDISHNFIHWSPDMAIVQVIHFQIAYDSRGVTTGLNQ